MGTRGHAHEPANGVTAGPGGSHRLQTGPGGCCRAQGEGSPCVEPPGVSCQGNRGEDMLGVGGSWVPTRLLSGCRAPVQAAPFSWGRVMAELSSWLVSHHQTHQRLRGALRKGVHPSGSLAHPPARFSPVPRAALSHRDCVRACQGQGLRLSQRGSNKILLPADLWEVTAAISTSFSWQAQAGEQGMLSLQIPEGMDN